MKSMNEILATPGTSKADAETIFADGFDRESVAIMDAIIATSHETYVEIHAIDVETGKRYAAYCGKDASSLPDDFEFGDASVDETAIVADSAWVYADAQVDGNAQVRGKARVCGHAKVSDDAKIYGAALVSGKAVVHGEAQVKGVR